MLDLHIHILPELDDGPRTEDEALELARAVLAAGTTAVAATPHIDHRWHIQPADVDTEVRRFQELLAQAEIPLMVTGAGEIAAGRVGELADDELRALSFGQGSWILLECPFTSGAHALEGAIFDLRSRGFSVVLAHPERSREFQQDPALLERLRDGGAALQVTAGALRGEFGSAPRKFAHHLVRSGMASHVASDAHDTRVRPPDMARPLLGSRAQWLTEDVPQAILGGGGLPEAPDPEPGPRRRLPNLFRRR